MTSPRDEIRSSSYGELACPSCGRMAGDIVATSHRLILIELPGGLAFECRDGLYRTCADMSYDELVAGANISVADSVTFGVDRDLGLLQIPRKPSRFYGLIELISGDGK